MDLSRLSNLYLELPERIKSIDPSTFDPRKIDYSSQWVQLLVLIVAILLLSAIIDFILSHTIFGKSYRFFVAPGVVLHELSHAFFCLITGAKIKNINFFEPTGGSVTHEPPRIAFIGPVLIAFAPLLFGIALLFILSHWIGLNANFDLFHISVGSLASSMKDIISSIDFHNYVNWILFYLIFSIAITMTPSQQDFHNALLSLLVLAILVYVLFWIFNIHFDLSFIPLSKLLTVLSTVLVLLIFAALLSMIVYALTRVVNRAAPAPVS